MGQFIIRDQIVTSGSISVRDTLPLWVGCRFENVTFDLPEGIKGTVFLQCDLIECRFNPEVSSEIFESCFIRLAGGKPNEYGQEVTTNYFIQQPKPLPAPEAPKGPAPIAYAAVQSNKS